MNKKLVLGLSLLWSALSVAAPPNDTATGIISAEKDCGAVKVIDSYYTLFGGRGGAGKALVVRAAVRNESFHKRVFLGKAGRWPTEAINTPSYWQAHVSIQYEGQSQGMDFVTLIDNGVGPEMSDDYELSVEMNGRRTSCAFRVGQVGQP